MARSTRALAQSPSPSASSGIATIAAPAARLRPLQDSAEALTLRASDEIDTIHDVQRAYACLERLIAPQRVNDPEEVHVTRSELGALLRLLNAELQRGIDTAVTTIESVRAALIEGS
jgi:hypothetical protein